MRSNPQNSATFLRINADLLAAARARAREDRTTVSAMIRRGLAREVGKPL